MYSVSSIFRENQVFFRWYGRSYSDVLRCVTHFFVQNEASRELLARKGITNVTVAGDTRFDRVLDIPAQRTRAELRIVGRVDDELFCSLRQLTTQLLVGQTAVERRDLQVDDTSALRPFPDRSSAVRFQSRG